MESGKIKIGYSKEEQEYIQKMSRDLDAILHQDNGNYINNCFSRIIESDLDRQAFEQLVKSMQYNYSNEIMEFILSILINPPFVAYEAKKHINEQNVIEFIDYLVFHFGGKIAKLYKINILKLIGKMLNPIQSFDKMELHYRLISSLQMGRKNISQHH